jgi:ATP-binding cassette subfamily C protein CydC
VKLGELIRIGLPQGSRFSLGLLLAVLQGLSAVALLASSAWLIARCSERPAEVYVSIAVVGVRAFAVGRAGFRYAERMVLHDTAFRMLARIRPMLLARMIPLAPVGLVRFSHGKALQGLVGDVDELQNLSLRVIAPVVQSVVVSLVSAAFLALFAPPAGLALLVCATAALLIAVPAGSAIGRRADGELVQLKSRISQLTLGLIESAALLEAFGWRETVLDELAEVESALQAKQRRSSLASGLTQGSFATLGVLATAATTWFGAQVVAANQQPGVMLAVIALVPMAVFDVLANSQNVAQSWNRYRAAATNVNELLELERPNQIPIEASAAQGASSISRFEKLELVGVAARYPDSVEAALQGANLTLKPGQVVVIRGESGAGKSTLANVLLRFLEPAAGEYRINGQDVRGLSIAEVRALVGLIEQQPVIFTGNVRQNLALAKPSATDGDLRDALERVGLWHMLEAREGLETFVGESGSRISGGEATRLALARALLANRSVIVLDEPTANLDAATAEATLRELVSAASGEGRAVIVISHDARLAWLTATEVVVEKPRP